MEMTGFMFVKFFPPQKTTLASIEH